MFRLKDWSLPKFLRLLLIYRDSKATEFTKAHLRKKGLRLRLAFVSRAARAKTRQCTMTILCFKDSFLRVFTLSNTHPLHHLVSGNSPGGLWANATNSSSFASASCDPKPTRQHRIDSSQCITRSFNCWFTERMGQVLTHTHTHHTHTHTGNHYWATHCTMISAV